MRAITKGLAIIVSMTLPLLFVGPSPGKKSRSTPVPQR